MPRVDRKAAISLRVFDAPRRLVFTEKWGGDWPETLNALSLVDHLHTMA